MRKVNNFYSGRHNISLLYAHLIFVTKYRYNVLTKTILEDLRIIFSNICYDYETKLVEFNGEKNHVHLLVLYPPKIALSSLVNSLKGVSSRLIRKKNYQIIQKKSGEVHSGLRVILQEAVEERLFLFCASN